VYAYNSLAAISSQAVGIWGFDSQPFGIWILVQQIPQQQPRHFSASSPPFAVPATSVGEKCKKS